MTTTKQSDILLWHYRCEGCGISDADSNYHAPTHMIYCEVCVEDGQYVKLQRWPVEPAAPHKGVKPGGEP